MASKRARTRSGLLAFRLSLAGISASLVAAALQACGSDDPAAANDAGVGVEAGAEAASPADGAPACDPNSDFRTRIPDASIADGASTSGACVSCASALCSTQVSSCNALCSCKDLAEQALNCYLQNSSNPTVCAGPFLSGNVDPQARVIGFGLYNCLISSCPGPCAAASFQGDAGTD